MNARLVVLLGCLFTSLTAPSWAEIYKTVDEDGNVTYSDTPKEKSEAVDLPEINTQPRTPIRSLPPTKGNAQEFVPKRYKISLISPKTGTQIPMGQQNVAINTQIAPPIYKHHRLQLFVNGQPYGDPVQGTNGILQNIYRGEHQVHAAVVTRKGRVISRSDSITIYVQRRSVLN